MPGRDYYWAIRPPIIYILIFFLFLLYFCISFYVMCNKVLLLLISYCNCVWRAVERTYLIMRNFLTTPMKMVKKKHNPHTFVIKLFQHSFLAVFSNCYTRIEYNRNLSHKKSILSTKLGYRSFISHESVGLNRHQFNHQRCRLAIPTINVCFLSVTQNKFD
jgi:hypothetical protein